MPSAIWSACVRACSLPSEMRTSWASRFGGTSWPPTGEIRSSAWITSTPTSLTANETVVLSRVNTDRWRSVAPARNRARNGVDRMMPSATAPMTGRTPTRSGRTFTAWSVTRSEMKARTSGSSSAVVARSANASESKTVRSR